MNRSYFPKLAATNLKKNRQSYIPYMLTCIFAIAMFFILDSFGKNDGLLTIRGGATLIAILHFGAIVIGIFSVILLFYTNSFLMKRRKKEIGLYNILGMEKKHLAYMMTYETLFTFGICLLCGLGIGLLLNKLMFLLLLRILQFNVRMTCQFHFSALVNTVLLFAGIFIFMLLYNLLEIRLAKPVELLSAEKKGEKEPKAKLFSTILGVLCLAAGYFIAVTTNDPLSAITLFFLAILLVIGGTYLLFTTGSIALLNALKRNKNYYYKTEHFISVSSLIYRMKQNAVGLASICILSTAVLLILSTTVSTYWGMEDILKTRYPADISITLENPTSENLNTIDTVLSENFAAYDVTIAKENTFQQAFLVAEKEDKTGSRLKLGSIDFSSQKMSDCCALYAFPLEDYNQMTGKNISLAANEILFSSSNRDFSAKTLNLSGEAYKIAGDCSDLPIIDDSDSSFVDVACIVFSDASQVIDYDIRYNEKTGETSLPTYIQLDLDGEKQNIHDFSIIVFDTLNAVDGIDIESREEAKESFFALYGTLFFIGIFLGALFLGATVLIIYYKQISEGFDDRERFILMEKVGLSKAEIKKAIHSQVLKVFFLPLIMAVIHIAFAFKMMVQLLALLSMSNIQLFLLCTVVTILIFAVIYALVYEMTAKTYYKIVN